MPVAQRRISTLRVRTSSAERRMTGTRQSSRSCCPARRRGASAAPRSSPPHPDLGRPLLGPGQGRRPSDKLDRKRRQRRFPLAAVTGETKYIDAAKSFSLRVAGVPLVNGDDTGPRNRALCLAIGYDWLYASLSANDRATIRAFERLFSRHQVTYRSVHFGRRNTTVNKLDVPTRESQLVGSLAPKAALHHHFGVLQLRRRASRKRRESRPRP